MSHGQLIVFYSILLFTIVYSVRRWHKLSPPFRWLSVFMAINLLVLLASQWMSYRHKQNLPVFHVYNILAIPVAGAAFISWMRWKKTAVILIGICTVFAIVNPIYLQNWKDFPTYSNALNGIMFTAICMMGYYDILQHHISEAAWKNDLLIKTTAFLIYFSTMGIIWGPYKTTLDRVIDNSIIHFSNSLINFIVFLLFGYSIILNLRRLDGRK